MADITDKLLNDMSKVKSKGKNAKSRANAENRQQGRLLANFAKAVGKTSLSAFTKRLREMEHTLNKSKNSNQRVTIKASYSIEKNPVKAKKLLKAHIAYISRENTGDSRAFSADHAELDKSQLKGFAEGLPAENEKTFRFIISPEKAKDFENDAAFKSYIKDCMERLSRDLPGKPQLNWIANIHYDTDNPHCHVLLKGLSKDGKDIHIPKEYIKTKFRERAESIATAYLGVRTEKDMKDARLSEVTAQRLTSTDFEIINNIKDNVFNLKTYDKAAKNQEYRLTNYIIPRLEFLCDIGLATKEKTKYTLQADFKETLQEMPLNNDIIKQLARLKKIHTIDGISQYDVYSTEEPIKGIIIDKNLPKDDIEEKGIYYLMILDFDNKSHLVKINKKSDIASSEINIGYSVELKAKTINPKNGGNEYSFPVLSVFSTLSTEEQITHNGITYLDKLITTNTFRFDSPNQQQQQLTQAVEARIEKLLSEKKLYNIQGRYVFAKTYWLDAEKQEHAQLTQNLKNLTYTRLSENDKFTGRIIGTHAFGDEHHAIVSNGKEYIAVPIRGRMNKFNDNTTIIDVTMISDRKGYSAARYDVKAFTGAITQTPDRTRKI